MGRQIIAGLHCVAVKCPVTGLLQGLVLQFRRLPVVSTAVRNDCSDFNVLSARCITMLSVEHLRISVDSVD
jgi:hypothetical protein